MATQLSVEPDSIAGNSCALSANRSDHPTWKTERVERSRIARVMLVDTDRGHAERVRAGLGSHDFDVEVFANVERAVQRLRRPGTDYDIVILNVSNDLLYWGKILESLQAAGIQSGVYPSPLLLCTSCIKRSPEFELQIERMGARYVYEG